MLVSNIEPLTKFKIQIDLYLENILIVIYMNVKMSQFSIQNVIKCSNVSIDHFQCDKKILKNDSIVHKKEEMDELTKKNKIDSSCGSR